MSRSSYVASWGLAAILLLTGCALPGLIYTNVEGPYSYRSAVPSDVKASDKDPEARGEACQRSLFFLVSWGNGGYGAAVDKALNGRQDAVLYNVKCDVAGEIYVFGLYSKLCTVVSGRIGKI